MDTEGTGGDLSAPLGASRRSERQEEGLNSRRPAPLGRKRGPTTTWPTAKAPRAPRWAVPVLTGGVLVTGARLEELWRLTQVSKGILARVVPGR